MVFGKCVCYIQIIINFYLHLNTIQMLDLYVFIDYYENILTFVISFLGFTL